MRVDKASFGGIILALGGVLAGLLLEGGNLGQILQPTEMCIRDRASWEPKAASGSAKA